MKNSPQAAHVLSSSGEKSGRKRAEAPPDGQAGHRAERQGCLDRQARCEILPGQQGAFCVQGLAGSLFFPPLCRQAVDVRSHGGDALQQRPEIAGNALPRNAVGVLMDAVEVLIPDPSQAGGQKAGGGCPFPSRSSGARPRSSHHISRKSFFARCSFASKAWR